MRSKPKTNLTNDPGITSIGDVYAAFLVAREAANVTVETMRFYRRKLGRFVEWAESNGAPTIGSVTAQTVRAYLVHCQKRGLAPWTVHGHARAVKAFLNFAASDNYIDAAPRFAMPKLPKELLPALSETDVKRLLDVCDHDRDRLIILCLLDTGCRASEFVALNGGDVDLSTGGVLVQRGKGQKQRMVYLGAKTRRALGRYWRDTGKPGPKQPLWTSRTTGERLTGDGLRQLLQRLGETAGVENCSPHAFRRSFALWSLRAGMDVYSLQRLMGHSDLQTLRRYLDQSGDDVRQAHQAAGPVDRLLKK